MLKLPPNSRLRHNEQFIAWIMIKFNELTTRPNMRHFNLCVCVVLNVQFRMYAVEKHCQVSPPVFQP